MESLVLVWSLYIQFMIIACRINLTYTSKHIICGPKDYIIYTTS